MEVGHLALRQDMTLGRRRAGSVVAAFGIPAALVTTVVLGAVPAEASSRVRVTLRSSRDRVTFGKAVTLSGRIKPRAKGATVRIVDSRGNVRARATTDKDGRYFVRFTPNRRLRLRARHKDRSSAWLVLRVRPVVRARLPKVQLFGKARVEGAVRPKHGGRRVTVRLLRNGNVIRTRAVALQGPHFSTRFRIKRPGRYRAKATFDDWDHLEASDRSPRRRTRLPNLDRGARRPVVRLLEKRLRRLGYLLRKVNRRYDFRTVDAVRAFNKVQGRRRVGTVNKSTWYALADPKRPRPRARKPRFHIEIDQTKQVLYTVKRGTIVRILHTSTGRGGVTRDGVWHVFRKIAGYSPGRLYYPSYFDGLRAIHGWPSVPINAASHGCARVPMWAAKWIYRKADIGTQVRIYH